MPPFPPPLSPPPPGSRPLAASFDQAAGAAGLVDLARSLRPLGWSRPVAGLRRHLAGDAAPGSASADRRRRARRRRPSWRAAPPPRGPAPAARPLMPDIRPLPFLLVGGEAPPAFFIASRTTCPSASRTAPLRSLAMKISPLPRNLSNEPYPSREQAETDGNRPASAPAPPALPAEIAKRGRTRCESPRQARDYTAPHGARASMMPHS